MKTPPTQDLFASAERLLGRTPDDGELQKFLEDLRKWPLPAFGPEELSIYLADKDQGFCLQFDDSSTIQHPVAAGKVAETPLFVRCFFYAEGVEEYHAFSGTLPNGITWSDNATSLVSKIGLPKHEIKSKKTGKLTGHRWARGQWMLTASYKRDGAFLEYLDLGIF
jgi:hypothetical protein